VDHGAGPLATPPATESAPRADTAATSIARAGTTGVGTGATIAGATDTALASDAAPTHARVQSGTRKRMRAALLGLGAVAVVVGIILVIRLVESNPNSGSGPTTPVTHHSSAAAQHHVVAGVTAAQVTQYTGYANAFVTANATATKGFLDSSKNPTELATVVSTYRTAANLYDFQLHFIAFPASMQTALAVEHAQFHALLSFLESYSSTSTIETSAWLSQLHNRTGTTQVADNQIRKDMGLPPTNSFP
jgi:hypothetical protein